MNLIALFFVSVATAAFCCLAAYSSDEEERISGDWRKWGFDSDPLAPTPVDSETV